MADPKQTAMLPRVTDESKRFTTLSGAPSNVCTHRADLPDFHPATDLGEPGQFPYTRKIHRNMYRSSSGLIDQ